MRRNKAAHWCTFFFLLWVLLNLWSDYHKRHCLCCLVSGSFAIVCWFYTIPTIETISVNITNWNFSIILQVIRIHWFVAIAEKCSPIWPNFWITRSPTVNCDSHASVFLQLQWTETVSTFTSKNRLFTEHLQQILSSQKPTTHLRNCSAWLARIPFPTRGIWWYTPRQPTW